MTQAVKGQLFEIKDVRDPVLDKAQKVTLAGAEDIRQHFQFYFDRFPVEVEVR
tara:strand:+ start:354 stop:512 length:159 start_codon:yes stop_codon:yes gene_type:complete